MNSQDAIELTREALMMALVLSSPILAVGLVVGLSIGLLQALTQVQEQTVSFVPKLAAMILTLFVALPWLISRLVDYAQELVTNIPNTL